MLFMKENADQDNCPIYKESRWKDPNDGAEKGAADVVADGINNNKKRLPRKILRYFPLTPRLQRIYMLRAHHQK